MNHVTYLLSSAEISMFSAEIGKFSYIKKYRYRFHFGTKFLIILKSLKIFLINIDLILMMLEKMVTLDLLKINVF